MALNPTIRNLKPTREDPEVAKLLKQYNEEALSIGKDGQMFIDYILKHLDEKDLFETGVMRPYRAIKSFGIKPEKEGFRGEQMSKTFEDAVRRKLASPELIARMMLAVLDASKVDAQSAYVRSTQGGIRNSNGTLNMNTVVMFLGPEVSVPQNLLYKYVDTPQFKKEAKRGGLDITGQRLLDEGKLQVVVIDTGTGKVGVQYENLALPPLKEKASIYFANRAKEKTEMQQYSEYYARLAVHELKQDHFAAVQEDCNRAIKLWPGNPFAYETLAAMYLEKGDYTVALRFALQSVGLEPNNEQSQLLVGQILMELGRPELAVKSFARAGRLAPDDYIPSYEMAKAYYELGQEALTKALKDEKEGAGKDKTSKDDALKDATTSADLCGKAQRQLQIQGRTDPQANKMLAAITQQKQQALELLQSAQQQLGAKPPEKIMH
jgi:Tfp pilus assembly protein PilF